MKARRIDRVALAIAGAGVVLTVGAFAIGGTHTGVGALCGAIIATLNWLAMRWIMQRLVHGTNKSRANVAIFMPLKFAALFAVCWFLLTRGRIDPIGFAIGLSALLLGVFAGAFRFGEKSPLLEKEG